MTALVVLDTTSKKLRITVDANATTTESKVIVDYAEQTSSAPHTPASSVATTNGTTAVDILAAPGASNQRTVGNVIIYNDDTVAHTYTVYLDISGTIYNIFTDQSVSAGKSTILTAAGAAGEVVTSVTASGELASSGGTTPDISIDAFPANEFLAGATSGGSAVPTSRLLSYLDIIAGSMTPIIGIAIFSYEVAAGTNGGTYTASAYATRPLNTTRLNTIPSASLSSNVISLPAGTYRAGFWVNGYATNSFVYRLRNTTDGATLSVGLTGNNATINVGISWDDFTLAGTKSIELQQAGSTTRANDGMGTPANLTETEVYAIVMIERIA